MEHSHSLHFLFTFVSILIGAGFLLPKNIFKTQVQRLTVFVILLFALTHITPGFLLPAYHHSTLSHQEHACCMPLVTDIVIVTVVSVFFLFSRRKHAGWTTVLSEIAPVFHSRSPPFPR